MNLPAEIKVAIIGGGPAGLMAAEVLGSQTADARVFDAMPSVARKFLLAGKGGLNLTHSEPIEPFLVRYGRRRSEIEALLSHLAPTALREWAHGLGIETFVGSSGRVFPADMKAAPLLRAWLHRLRESGVRFHMRHRWVDWTPEASRHRLIFDSPGGRIECRATAVVLALGGGSWARLGSDGKWVGILRNHGVDVTPLVPSNCGFDVTTRAGAGWSEYFREKFAGQPLKTVAVSVPDGSGISDKRIGEFVITQTGIEGSLIYAFSARLRDTIAAQGSATLLLDLAPNWEEPRLAAEIARPRGSRSLSSHLQSRTGMKGLKMGLLREIAEPDDFADATRLASKIKALPIRLAATRPIDEAISSAGGVRFEGLDDHLMIRSMPGVFCAGEMLDWEAPTGGYLLTACMASGRVAGTGALQWLEKMGEAEQCN